MSPEQYAVNEFGWTLEEFGKVTPFLLGMRNMLQHEINTIEDGKLTSQAYGFQNDSVFVRNNRKIIIRIDDALLSGIY